ncbi:MAG: methylated-DNA--[protein]-cysteine S-methyltransferase [Phormidesmis sp. RL_2_1]|nr:methylated-DNA--[protein]-cysteine S-methyltransferase [Phormidesmis sp. RL_2_1]
MNTNLATDLFLDLETDTIETPIGTIVIVVRGDHLCALDFEDCRTRMMKLLQRQFKPVELVSTCDPAGISTQVKRYFAGEVTALAAVPTLTGGTAFQQQVWQGLRQIEPGQVMTYGELARTIGNAKAVRAVGMANSLNPVAIALPCHRVVGANGKLTGYAGGLERKRWLLAHESI